MSLLDGMPVTLRPLKTGSGPFRVGTYTAGSIRMDPVHEVHREGEAVRARVIAHVLARQLVGDQQLLEVRHPATWWQHLKLSLPGWIRKRWPVRYCTARARVSFTKYDAYPGAGIPMPPEFGTPVQYDMVSFGPAAGDECGASSCRSTPVNAGREFLTREQLMTELSHLVDMQLSAVPGIRFPPRAVTQELIKVLERLGVNPGQLVQQYAIDEAHRTW